MQKAMTWPTKVWVALVVLALAGTLAVGIMATSVAEADNNGVHVRWSVNRTLPGSATQRYIGNYTGTSFWTRGSYARITRHRSEMSWNNNNNVQSPFVNIYYYRDGDLLFRIPNGRFRTEPAILPAGWHRHGGINTTIYGVSNSSGVTAKGTYGFQLCSGGHCASGLNREARWNLW
jgi:hypothetical protein